ncbi:MAG: tetratricopeptide repeat protein [Rhodoferax sp.]|nr:tetratricopeptide repeat protein [Rhodoferax sp.]
MDIHHQAQQLGQKAVCAWHEGKHELARDLLRSAISIHPDVPVYHANLAMMLKDAAPVEERVHHYRRAIELDPTVPMWYANLASVLNEQTEHIAAETTARAGLAIDATRPETWFNLGGALAGQQRWQEAAVAFDSALEQQPEWLVALIAAGQVYRATGQLRQAIERYSAASAQAHLREALQYQPGDLGLLTDLGNSLTAQGKLDEALVYYQQVVLAAPHLAGAHVNVGTLCQTLGQHEEALIHYRTALAIDPTLPTTYGNMGTSLTYSASHGPADLKACYDKFNQLVARPLYDSRSHTNDRSPNRRLRVGYVSADFRRHAVAYFALPLLQGHHPEEVEIYCYYNHRQNDEWTQRFKELCAGWVDCVGWDDAALAERIRTDNIDILVDLAGHTEGGRLLTFARKPAPIQLTWMGYVTTTGLSTMDYRLTHVDADPVGDEADYSENLVRLEGTMWCYRALPDMPEVSEAPFTHNGYVTFGSFNRFSKASRRVLECWAQILCAIQDSKLLLCIPEGTVRQQVTEQFAQYGVPSARLRFFSKVSHAEFWSLHAEVDIALDPFPFGGGTTSCETLWLGVPIVTCTGGADSFVPRFASRMGKVFLNALGLPDLVTENESEYVKAAIKLASDPKRLIQLRQELRPRMAVSALTDEKRFVREVETAYRHMWHQWLDQTSINQETKKP